MLVVVLTSNVGATAFESGGRAVGFGAAERQQTEDANQASSAGHPGTPRALEQARAAFPPELWGRLDERLVFAARVKAFDGNLSPEEVAACERLGARVQSRLA